MSNIDSPAVARRRVRLALRSARQAKRLTQTQVAHAMEWSLSKVMRIEKGDVNVSPNDLKALLDYLKVSDPHQIQELLGDARLSRQERWIVDPADREHLTPAMIELFQFEAEAMTIRYYNNLIIPGILQTRAYSEVLLRGYSDQLEPETVAARITVRQARLRGVLYRAKPPDYLVILDESVLLRPVGGPSVMAEQLEHLLSTMDETPLRVRILPFVNAATSLVFYGAFALHDLKRPALSRDRHDR
jgi:transcriptional regulator with XRE-family HTH domain